MTDGQYSPTEEQRAFGRAFAEFKKATRVNSDIPRCAEVCWRGSQTGICDTPLDADGNCRNAQGHVS